MRSVDAAWLEETERCRDAEASEDGERLDVLRYVSPRLRAYRSRELTAARVAPPFAPAAGLASLKSKTVSFLKASPVSRVCDSPVVSSLWNFLIAVGAVKRSLNSSVLLAGGAAAGAGVALGWAAWG